LFSMCVAGDARAVRGAGQYVWAFVDALLFCMRRVGSILASACEGAHPSPSQGSNPPAFIAGPLRKYQGLLFQNNKPLQCYKMYAGGVKHWLEALKLPGSVMNYLFSGRAGTWASLSRVACASEHGERNQQLQWHTCAHTQARMIAFFCCRRAPSQSVRSSVCSRTHRRAGSHSTGTPPQLQNGWGIKGFRSRLLHRKA